MVVYIYAKGEDQEGTGRICVIRDKKIISYEDVKSLDETIKESTGSAVAVTDFKLLRIFRE